MMLNASTDYAIKIIVYLARCNRVVSSKELSKAIEVSPRYLLQICARLRDAHLLSTSYGSTGGFELSLPPARISLFDIISVMENEHVFFNPAGEQVHPSGVFTLLTKTYSCLTKMQRLRLEEITIEKLIMDTKEEHIITKC